jgi:hypothetical protein
LTDIRLEVFTQRLHAEVDMWRNLFRFATQTVTGALLFAAAFAAPADEYSWEISGGQSQTNITGGSDTTSTGAAATHYFTPVDDTLGPYRYAAFLSRSSRITGAIRHDTTEYSYGFGPVPLPVSSFTARTDAYTVSGRYVWRESGWYAGGRAEHAVTDPAQPFYTDITLKGYSAFGGKYLGPSTTLDLTLESTESTTHVEPIACANPPCLLPLFAASKTSGDNVGVAVQHLGKLAAMHYAVAGHIGANHMEIRLPDFNNQLVYSQRARMYAVSGELLPTARIGVRLEYSSFSDDPARDHDYGLSASWFFKRNVTVQFSWLRTNPSGNSADFDDWSVGLLGRF